MAAAKPVVATAVGGTTQLVEHRRTGFLVPAGRPDMVAIPVGELLESPELAARMGRAGYDRARTHFPMEKMVNLNQQLYERLLRRS